MYVPDICTSWVCIITVINCARNEISYLSVHLAWNHNPPNLWMSSKVSYSKFSSNLWMKFIRLNKSTYFTHCVMKILLLKCSKWSSVSTDLHLLDFSCQNKEVHLLPPTSIRAQELPTYSSTSWVWLKFKMNISSGGVYSSRLTMTDYKSLESIALEEVSLTYHFFFVGSNARVEPQGIHSMYILHTTCDKWIIFSTL